MLNHSNFTQAFQVSLIAALSPSGILKNLTVSALTYLSNDPSGTYLKPFHLHHTNPQLKDLNKVIQRPTKSSMVAEASAEASTQGLLEAMIPSFECYY